MENLVTTALVGIFASIASTAAVGFVVWKLFSKRLVETIKVYEEPAKQRKILVPGDGVYTIHDKRKCRYIDEQAEYDKEQKRDK